MRKVRILISAAAISVIVGNALAFNAKSPSSFCIYQQNGTSTCLLVGLSDDAEVVSPTRGQMYVQPNFSTCPSSVQVGLCTETLCWTLE